MHILFICTAHNSLSQRLHLALSRLHTVTVEYALSDDTIREAVRLAKPNLIICPFLTTRVPADIYDEYLTLIVHPGPPGDAGPSSLDWVLMGDDGSETDAEQVLKKSPLSGKGRPYWGVTVLQAEAELDAGPVWAYEQFPLDIDEPGMTKSALYRGPVTRAAIAACLAAVERIQAAACTSAPMTPPPTPGSSQCPSPVSSSSSCTTIHPRLLAKDQFRELSVGLQKPFLGGPTHHRPLLKAGQRDFDPTVHRAAEISRRIRCADSQPGCLSSVLGRNMYLYGGIVEDGSWVASTSTSTSTSTNNNTISDTIVATRDEAVCIRAADGRGVWITHVRRVKKKTDAQLWPKVPAVSGLREAGLLDQASIDRLSRPCGTTWSRSGDRTFQEIYVDMVQVDGDGSPRVAYVYSELYNGAMSTAQCNQLVLALEYVASTHTAAQPLAAVVMMGGHGYFSNGIHLNVIEAAGARAAEESWANINRINDVVWYLVHEFPRRGVLTVAGMRGNAAAGGVALAAACDSVVAGADVVLNPAYRALGLYGSEFHSVSYVARCGGAAATHLLRDMTPLSAYDARALGLIDHVLPGHGTLLDTRIRNYVSAVVRTASSGSTISCPTSPRRTSSFGSVGGSRLPASPGTLRHSQNKSPGAWKARADLTVAGLQRARAAELGEMAQDFWSARAERYHTRRTAFVRKTRAAATPLRFAKHRRIVGDEQTSERLDEEEMDEFDSVAYFVQRQARAGREACGRNVADAGGVSGEPNELSCQISGQGPVFSCYYGA